MFDIFHKFFFTMSYSLSFFRHKSYFLHNNNTYKFHKDLINNTGDTSWYMNLLYHKTSLTKKPAYKPYPNFSFPTLHLSIVRSSIRQGRPPLPGWGMPTYDNYIFYTARLYPDVLNSYMWMCSLSWVSFSTAFLYFYSAFHTFDCRRPRRVFRLIGLRQQGAVKSTGH